VNFLLPLSFRLLTVTRLLDLGFREELEEIVKYCPVNRQTMLFSATMTSGVDDLIKLSLKRPIRIKTQGDATTVAPKLSQEFVRVRREEEREAMLAALVCRNFKTRVIVFFETKKEAHRFFVLLTLLESSLPICELHGDMTQPQRETALQRFIRGDCEVLIATDVAARGLDISNIQTVINSEMPRSTSTYIHRVGRTARAGKYGRSVTLVSDSRRKVMKDLLKSDANGGGEVDGTNGLTVLSRTVPAAVVSHFASKIAGLEGQIVQHFQEERVRTQTDSAMREVERAENLMIHEVNSPPATLPLTTGLCQDEIKSRPARTWHQTETQKEALKEAGRQRAQEESQAARKGLTVTELTALQKAQQMAHRDDYRDEDDAKAVKSSHRLTRKKRRRLDALKELEENGESESPPLLSLPHLALVSSETDAKASAKRLKTTQRETELTQRSKTGSDLGKQRKAKKSDNDAKVFRPVIAVGGLDQDMRDWNGGGQGGKTLRKARKKDAEEAKFSEFDAAKQLRKGGKQSNQSFKSKSRFKRR
jgi:ATP-dependent RNA helicase DDX27